MNIIVTGATGILGSNLLKTFESYGCKCTSFERAGTFSDTPLSLLKKLEKADIILHAAANTNVEECEKNPFIAYRDNALLTELISKASTKIGNKFVYISSIGVYGNHKITPYTDFDETKPTTHHHRSKLLGERCALSHNSALIIRTGWLFGGARNNAKNFVARRIEEGQSSKEAIHSNIQQKGCPTYVSDLSERIYFLLKAGHSGIFNCVNLGTTSRFEYVKLIFELSHIKTPLIPVKAEAFNRIAKVSDNEMAINMKQDMLNLPPMRNHKEALTEYIHSLLS